MIVFTAGFANAEVHAAQVAEEDPPLIAKLEEIGVEGRFENISADSKRLDVLRFDGTAHEQQKEHQASARGSLARIFGVFWTPRIFPGRYPVVFAVELFGDTWCARLTSRRALAEFPG